MEFFLRSLFTVGLACLIGAIVGGGLKAFGIELPLLASRARQALLGVVGLVMVGLALILSLPGGGGTPPQPAVGKPASPPGSPSSPAATAQQNAPLPPASASSQPPPAASPVVAPAPQPATVPGCPGPEHALDCLPPSSRPVIFADPDAANAVAWTNVRSGLSTSQAQARSIQRGASGRASRLCGIMQSNDSSPLALHNAAVKLNSAAGAEGAVDNVCSALIPKLL